MVADVISAAVNVFGRADGPGYPIAGPVWEYYSGTERVFKPQLRESLFVAHEDIELRAQLIAADLDGLIREVLLDRANGLIGKTVIHPSHVPVIREAYAPSPEQVAWARRVLDAAAGHAGVFRFEGAMVDGPVLRHAESVLRRAGA